MAIREGHVQTWSAVGAVPQSAATYQTIRNVLNDSSSPYYPKQYSIFLQGSYGNNTNVCKHTHNDIVMRLNDTFYSHLTKLKPNTKTSFDKAYPDVPYGVEH